MIFITLTRNYFQWHYTLAFVDIFHIWRNITTFLFNFFSIQILVKTFFSPWRRLHADRETEGFDLIDLLSTSFVNLTMRIVGALMRSMLIVIGLCAVTAVIVGGIIFFVFWILTPIIIVLLCAAGIHLLFQ